MSSTFLLFEPLKRTFQLDSGENGFLTKHVRFLMHSKRKYKEVRTKYFVPEKYIVLVEIFWIKVDTKPVC